MANKAGKPVDKTFLSLDTFEDKGQIHRDYIVHCLRWTHVAKHVARNAKEKRILDIGCGAEFPLPRLLRAGMMNFDYYAGIDYSRVDPKKYFNKSGKGWEPDRVWSETDFVTIPDQDFDNINTIVCFEVLEHVEPRHAMEMLAKMARIIQPGGTVFLSTPCWDEKIGAAANHVNEMTYEAFGSLIEHAGLGIKAHYGTFASQKDYKKHLTYPERVVFDALSKYYDSNYLSTIFAPLYPEYSRNCIWECGLPDDTYQNRFVPTSQMTGRLGSSDNWQDMIF